MRRGGRLSLVVAVVVAGLIAGCKTDQAPADDRALDDPPPAEVSPTTSPTPNAVDDPFAIPDEIDEEYLTLVMQELERIYVEGLQGIYQDEEVTDGNSAFLDAIYTSEEVAQRLEDFARRGVTRSDLRRHNLTPTPRVPSLEVTRILDNHAPECVFIEVAVDESAFLEKGVEAADVTYVYEALVPKEQAANPASTLNPTPWAIGYVGVHPDRERVEDPVSRCGNTGG